MPSFLWIVIACFFFFFFFLNRPMEQKGSCLQFRTLQEKPWVSLTMVADPWVALPHVRTRHVTSQQLHSQACL